MESYDERIFHAVAGLIHERDPMLDNDEIKRQALDLMREHVRTAVVHSISQHHSAPKPNELENLQKQAERLADALENLSLQSDIVLRFVSDPRPLPNLSRLQQDAEFLSEALLEGLKNMPPPPGRGRKKDLAKESLFEEATKVFEQAYGVSLNDLPKLPTQQRRNIKHKYFLFVRTYMPNQNLYQKQEQFETLKKAVSRYLSSRSKE